MTLHSYVQYRPEWHGEGHIFTTVGRIIFNERIQRSLEEVLGETWDPASYEFVNQSLRKRDISAVVEQKKINDLPLVGRGALGSAQGGVAGGAVREREAGE